MPQALPHIPADLEEVPATLDGRRLFFLACWEAFRDGVVDAEENQLLNQLRARLGLGSEVAGRIAAAARHDCQKRGLAQGRRLDPARLLARARTLAEEQGGVHASEQRLLDLLQELVGPSLAAAPAAPIAPVAPAARAAAAPPAPVRAPAARPRELSPPEVAAKKAGPSDSGGQEEGNRGGVFGAPASWGFLRLCSLAKEIVCGHWRFFGLLAVAAAMAGQIPLADILVRPLLTILVIGAVHDLVTGRETGELRVAALWERHAGAFWPLAWTGLVHAGLVLGVTLLVACVLIPLHMLLGGQGAAGVVAPLLGLTAACVLGILVFRAGLFSTQEVVLERRSGVEAIQAAYVLAARDLHTLCFTMIGLGGLFLIGVLGFTAFAALPAGLMIAGVAKAFGSGLLLTLTGALLRTVFGAAGGMLGLWFGVAWTLLYLRQKARAR